MVVKSLRVGSSRAADRLQGHRNGLIEVPGPVLGRFQDKPRDETHRLIHVFRLVAAVLAQHRADRLARIGHRINQVANELAPHLAALLRDIDPDVPHGLEGEIEIPNVAAEGTVLGPIPVRVDRQDLDYVVAAGGFV